MADGEADYREGVSAEIAPRMLKKRFVLREAQKDAARRTRVKGSNSMRVGLMRQR